MGTAASVEQGASKRVLFKNNCLGDGVFGFILSGEGYDSPQHNGRGRQIRFGACDQAVTLELDGQADKLSLRLASDTDLSLEVNDRKFKEGDELSLWSVNNKRGASCKFTVNKGDMTLSPHGHSSLVVGIDPTSHSFILVERDDLDVRCVFGDNLGHEMQPNGVQLPLQANQSIPHSNPVEDACSLTPRSLEQNKGNLKKMHFEANCLGDGVFGFILSGEGYDLPQHNGRGSQIRFGACDQ